MSARTDFERALTPGPWHQEWPFHCYFCGLEYQVSQHYPYCSAACSIDAETDAKLTMAKAHLQATEKRA